MSRVFDRDHPGGHPFDEALQHWLSTDDDNDPAIDWFAEAGNSPATGLAKLRAIAINIICDHRVSEKREESLLGFFKRPRDSLALRKAIVDYKRKKVRDRHLPEFAFREFNELNHIPPEYWHGRNRDYPLVRVLDLTGLHNVFTWARDNDLGRPFDRFPGNPESPRFQDQVTNWLRRRIERSESEVMSFFDKVFALLDEAEPYQPTWATTWQAFSDFADTAPDDWLDQIGVESPNSGRWLIMLKYPIRALGRKSLVRPTQLDAGWYAFHFPTPRQNMSAEGGHPMCLNTDSLPDGLLPEFVHTSIRHKTDHIVRRSDGFAIGQTAGTIREPFEELRVTHHGALQRKYGLSEVTDWMDDPNEGSM